MNYFERINPAMEVAQRYTDTLLAAISEEVVTDGSDKQEMDPGHPAIPDENVAVAYLDTMIGIADAAIERARAAQRQVADD